MTIEVTPDKIYFAICIVLLILQVYQHYLINKLKSETDLIWTQMGLLLTTISAKIAELDKKIENNGKEKQD